MKKLLILCLAVGALAACCTKKDTTLAADTPAADAQSKTPTFEILKEGAYGGREKAGNIIITSQKQLDGLYKELNLEGAPKVDFATKQVVALFMGQRSTGGYSVGIESVGVKGDIAEVVIKETYPEKGGMATMALTNPYCIAAIPKAKNVQFYQDPPPVAD